MCSCLLCTAGGPGCSSELAFFYENGPYHITEELGLELSEYGWDVNNNMIYVDQPINTGFSYSEVDTSAPSQSLHSNTDEDCACWELGQTCFCQRNCLYFINSV